MFGLRKFRKAKSSWYEKKRKERNDYRGWGSYNGKGYASSRNESSYRKRHKK